MKNYSLWNDYNKMYKLLEIQRTGPLSVIFHTREKEMLPLNTLHKLNPKLLAFITKIFYFTISYWYQRHLQALVICVNDGMWGDSQWNGDGCQTWGLGKIVSGWYLFSTFSKFLLKPLLRRSKAISSCPSSSHFLHAIDFVVDVEVRNLII